MACLSGLLLALALAIPFFAPADGDLAAPAAVDRVADQEIAAPTQHSVDLAATPRNLTAERSLVEAVANGPATAPRPVVPREHLLLRVVDDTTGLPAAGAEVAADLERIERISAAEERRRRAIADPFARLQASGQSALTDAQGYVVLRGSHWMQVMARQGDLLASATIELEAVSPEGFEFRLRPQPFTDVRALSQQRQPLAGVPLRLLVHYGRLGASGSDPREEPIGCTDSTGTLRVQVGHHLRQHRPVERIEVFVAAPGLTATRARVEAAGAPIELVLPPHGIVEIPVAEGDGRPLADDPTWSVSMATIGGSSDSSPPEDGTIWDLGTAGAVRFPYVGLGLELQATARISAVTLQGRLTGPLRQGEHVRHQLTLGGSEHCTLQARLVDEHGQPWANTWVMAELGDSTLWGSQTRTDDAGRFQMRITVEPGSTEALRLQGRDDNGPLGRSCEIHPPSGSSSDLGDVILPRGETIARGTIVEERPVPPGLSLRVECLSEGEWHASAEYGIHRPDPMSFTIHRHPAASPGRLRLCVHAPGCEPIVPTEFSPGAELSIVLRAGLTFRARILIRPELLASIDNEDCYAFLLGEHGDEHGLAGRVVGNEWQVQCHGCRAGRYGLEIGGCMTLAAIDGIVLTPDGLADPRLDPWDLRETIQLVQVLSVDASGALADTSATLYLRDEQRRWQWCGWSEQGIARLVLPRRPMELLVRFDDGGFATLPNAMDTVRVVVPSATPITVVLDGMPDLTADAPIEVDLVVEESTMQASGLPDVQLLGSVSWMQQQNALSAQLFASVHGSVRIMHHTGEGTTEVLEQLPCTLSRSNARTTVTIPESLRERLRPWTKSR